MGKVIDMNGDSPKEIVKPKLVVFLDLDDVMPCLEELEKQGVNMKDCKEIPLEDAIYNGLHITLSPYDGGTYLSKECRDWLSEPKNMMAFVDKNRSDRKKMKKNLHLLSKRNNKK